MVLRELNQELNSFEGRMLLMADHGVPLAQLPRDSECQWFDIASIYYSEYDYIRDTI